MIRTFLVSATIATVGFAAPAFADSAYIHIGTYDGYVQGGYHTAPRYVAPRYVAPVHASRSYSVEGAYGGSDSCNSMTIPPASGLNSTTRISISSR